MDNLSKKSARSLGVMYKIRSFLNTNMLINLYYSLIYPHLLYPIHVWGFAFNINLDKLKILQKRVIKVISFHDNTSLAIKGHLAHSAPLLQ